MPENDKNNEFLKGLRSGNLKERRFALKKLYSENYNSIFHFIKKNNGNQSDFEDIFQESIIVLYEKMVQSDFELNCSVKTYLYSIAKNKWMNKLRQRKTVVEISNLESDLIFSDETDAINLEKETPSVIKKLLGKLDAESRRVLILYYFDRMKMKDIAQTMGYANQQVAKNKKSRTLKKLRAMLSQTELNILLSQ